MAKDYTFYSGPGLKLVATFYLPASAKPGEQLPTVILCHGTRCNRKIILPAFAAAFAEQGFAALAFDYRGFGESEGQRHRLIARERVEDIVNATTFATTLAEVDPARIGLFGISYGAANVISAAAIDGRVKATVAQGGFDDGDRWMRTGRTLYEYWEFRKRVEADRVKRVTTGQSEHVDAFDIMIPTPAENAYRTTGTTAALKMEMPLESADSIFSYDPGADVAKISPRAVFLIGAELDYIVDGEASRRLYEKAKEPKRLHMLAGQTHTEPYGRGLPEVVEKSSEFFREFLV